MEELEFSVANMIGEKLAAVRCTLSNGKKSPLFINESLEETFCQKKITFEKERPISKVMALNGPPEKPCVFGLNFFDNSGKNIGSFDPGQRVKEKGGVSYSLRQTEEIIGVYGVKDRARCLSSFGFIVKVWHNN